MKFRVSFTQRFRIDPWSEDRTVIEDEVLSSLEGLAAAASLPVDLNVAAERFFAATSQLPVRGVDRWERTLRNELYSYVHNRRSLNLWTTREPHGPWLNLCHGDGYERMQALEALSQGAPNSFLLAVLLRRLNDWVVQVREAARESAKKIAARTDTEIVVDALWNILPYLHTWGRWKDEDRDAFLDLVSPSDVSEKLTQRLIQSTAGPTAKILGQLSRRSTLDQYLTQIAQEAVQPAVRAKAYRFLFEGKATWLEGRKWVLTDKYWGKREYQPILGTRSTHAAVNLVALLDQAIGDASPTVRRVAGTTVIARLAELGSEAEGLASRLAVDPYPSIAERGRFALDRVP